MADSLLDTIVTNFYSELPTTIIGNEAIRGKVNPVLGQKEEVVSVVPDHIYRPRIKVAIDFNHVYTLNLDQAKADELNIQNGSRIIPKKTLISLAIDIANYYLVFFETLSIKMDTKSKIQDSMQALLQNISSGNDDAINLFLNQFINMFITNINVDRSLNQIGNATVTLRDSTYIKNNVRRSAFFDNAKNYLYQLFSPYLPISIWVNGRIYQDCYFPIYNGFIFTVNPKDSQGYKQLDLICKDMLEFCNISTEMLNPSIIQLTDIKNQNYINIYSKPMYGMSHIQIFKTMFEGGSLAYSEDVASIINTTTDDKGTTEGKNVTENNSSNDQSTSGSSLNISSLGFFFDRLSEYNDFINGDKNYYTRGYIKQIDKNQPILSEIINRTSYTKNNRSLIYWGENLTPFSIFSLQSMRVYSSDFASRFAILQEISGNTFYNFYISAYGDVCFHPLRLSNDYFINELIYKSNNNKINKIKHKFSGIYTINKHEILDATTTFNIDVLVTYLVFKGLASVDNTVSSEPGNLYGIAIDKKLMERYGYRRNEIQKEFLNENPTIKDSTGKTFKFFDMVATELLKYTNGELQTKTVNIILRPEMELGYPVYFTENDEVYYIQSISHNIAIGGSATTTINCNLGRKSYESPPDLYSYMLTNEYYYRTKNFSDTNPYIETNLQKFKAEQENFILPFTEKNEFKEKEANEAELMSQVDFTLAAINPEGPVPKKLRDQKSSANNESRKATKDKAIKDKQKIEEYRKTIQQEVKIFDQNK